MTPGQRPRCNSGREIDPHTPAPMTPDAIRKARKRGYHHDPQRKVTA
jgi:hypothetical protein